MIHDTELLPQQPDTHQKPPQHSFRQFKLLTLIVAILLSAVMAGAGGYFLRIRTNKNATQSTQRISVQPSPTSFIPKTFYAVPSTNPMLTSNWKTYKSEKYHFTFLYPSRMIVNYIKPLKAYQLDEEIFFTTSITYDNFWKNKSEQERQLMQPQKGITGGDLLVAVEGKDFFEDTDTLDTLKNTWTDYKDEGIMVGEKNGRIISGYDYVSDQKKTHIRYIDIPLQQGKHLKIEYYEDTITLEEFNQILSTFKFLHQY
jgi:hypothetical protein